MRTPRPVKGVNDVETCFGVAVDLIVYVASVPAIYGRQWVLFGRARDYRLLKMVSRQW